MKLFIKVVISQKPETRKAGNVRSDVAIYLPITSISYVRNRGGGNIEVVVKPDVKIDVGFPDFNITTTHDELGIE